MNVDNLAYVKKHLLEPCGIDDAYLTKCLNILAERNIDFGDIFFEHTIEETFSLDESIIKGGSFVIKSGFGTRAVLGEKHGFAYSDVIEPQALLDACHAARSISSGLRCDHTCILSPRVNAPLYVQDNPIDSLDRDSKVAILKQVDEVARSLDSRVSQVMASLHQYHRLMLVANTDGTLSADVKPVVQLTSSVVLQDGTHRESGFAAMGGSFMMDRILQGDNIAAVAKEAVRLAQVNLEAKEAPAGLMPVVLGAGWPGVLIHEAVGHGLEADANYTNMSTYANRIGEKVASSACTIIDDGTIKERRGSQSCDDEGTATAHNVLIEKGILKGYMQDRKTANLMKSALTGNGRRESYDYVPIPRMTNTYMLPGEYDKQEVIESVKRGIYAVNFKGGQVDITSGRFVFSASEAYMIENGKISYPIKGVTLIGNGPETMQKVSMVANDLEFDEGIGMCGKAGQGVMVGIGQPTLKIDEITIGGTSTN